MTMPATKSTSPSPSPSASPSLSPSPPLPSSSSSSSSRSRPPSFTNTPLSSSPLSRVATSGSDSAATIVPSTSLQPSVSSATPPAHSFSSLLLSAEGDSTAQLESYASSSSFRIRSRSPGRAEDPLKLEKALSASFTWWGNSDEKEKIAEKDDKARDAMISTLRPWREASSGPPKRKGTIPQQQTEGWLVTRQRVAQAVRAVLGTAVDVAHEALVLSADVLELAPVPGLSPAARTLLLIWDSLQLVDLNRLQCLRLTERCADILLSVRQEVREAGDQVTEELAVPITKLTEAFNSVYVFLQKQAHRPFLKRYLKRDEILRQIQGCDVELQEALGMFSLSIQIRILKQVQASEAHRQAENKILLDEVVRDRKEREEERVMREADKKEREADRERRSGLNPSTLPPPYPSTSSTTTLTSTETVTPVTDSQAITAPGEPPAGPSTYPAGPLYATYPLSPTISGQSTSATPTVNSSPPSLSKLPTITIPDQQQHPSVLSPPPSSPTSLSKALEAVRIRQNLSDAALDAQDLRNLMREALATGNDMEMLQVLGVGREEMPEAIKTMQRALETFVEKERQEEDESVLRLKEFQNEMVGGFHAQNPNPNPNPDDVVWKGGRPGVTRSSSATSRVSVGLAKMARRISVQGGVPTVREEGDSSSSSGSEGKGGWLKGRNGVRRSKTVSTQMTGTSTSGDSGVSGVSAGGSGGSSGSKPKDTLDREFMESGIDALRRMSRGAEKELSLPSWTITRYEVDREKKIGIGFFSDVYRGTWRNRTVAIKVLAETTPRNLFRREIGIWKQLFHPNVLQLCGASSASGDPPWFFVSPYLKNGSLSDFLRRIVNREGGPPVGLGLPGYLYPSSGSIGRLAVSPSAATITENGGGGGGGSRVRTASYPGWSVVAGGDGTSRSRAGSFSGSGSGGGVVGLGLQGVPAVSNLMSTSSSQIGHRRGRSGSGSGSAPGMAMNASAVLLGEVEKEWDLLKFMHEIAKGMEYLHSNGVLHGDLKAANVLVDDKIHCVISDFGQSEMKSEAYRISGTPPPHGTLRWQAPELMSGVCQLTVEMDVYAFGITAIEILSMGRMPWPLMDDDAVRHFVLKDNSRPTIPQTRFSTAALQGIIQACWEKDPFLRPAFSQVARDLKKLRKNGDSSAPEDVMSPRMPESMDYGHSRPSPDMRPIPLPSVTPPRDSSLPVLGNSPGSTSDASFRTARERDLSYSPPITTSAYHREDSASCTSRVQMPEPVIYTPSAPSSATSSIFTSDPSTRSETDSIFALGHPPEYDGYDSPPPLDSRLAEARDERRYRMLLVHDFHPSLTLPLWSPNPVAIGAVGYLQKPQGKFVTLFNAFNTEKSKDVQAKGIPSVYGYGKVTTGLQRQDKRNAAQRGLDALAGFLTFRNGLLPQGLVRRYSYPLRVGHKAAYLCTESTIYRYVESLDSPKKWFKANVDAILDVYGSKHHIQKEDLYFVIGTLDAPEHGLFVSHSHPDGQVHFNVYASTRSKQPWGSFTTDTAVRPELGPTYDEPVSTTPVNNSKVSNAGGEWQTVLIARLRFKPDVLEPTSL
ncbi:hypothetical protein E1B28_003613 [Marasmius oreades]|nr:uncharacterized protein E1B28_003613 [Marasmius oreades]KAG7086098.1 hypothetical protein E1B28_003613 [Marasmius oreades]